MAGSRLTEQIFTVKLTVEADQRMSEDELMDAIRFLRNPSLIVVSEEFANTGEGK